MRAFLLGLLSLAVFVGGAPARAEDPKPAPEKVERGYLGFEPCPAQLIPPEIATGHGIIAFSGVVVIRVTKDAPAEKAGVKVGDFLVKLNGKEMPSTDGIDPAAPYEGRKVFDEAFAKIAETMKPGAEIELVVTRKGETLTLKATAVTEAVMKRIAKGLPPVEEKPAPPSEPAADQGAVGFEALPLGSLTEKQRDEWKVKAASGVVVSRVVKGSPADLAGLKLGDALLKYGGVEMPSSEDLADAGSKAKELVRDAIAKIEADLKVDGEIEVLVRRDFKPWKLKAKAVTQAALKALIEAETSGKGGPKDKDGPPEKKEPEKPEKPAEDPPKEPK